jgi:hypothetical protein
MIINGKINKKYRLALDFFASKLFTPQLKRYIEVNVKFRKNMGDFHGIVSVEDYNVLGTPRSFVIELAKDDPEVEILKTLAHEMVHVRQYARSELNESMTLWKGRQINADQIPYREQPWEQEAFKLGDELYDLYTKET